MKTTKRQLRQIIKEEIQRVITENLSDDQLTELVWGSIEMTLTDNPGIGGEELANIASQHPAVDVPLVFTMLDTFLEDGEVLFDEEEDAWYLAGTPEADRFLSGMADANRGM
jgi:dihydrofolate reductase